MTLAAPPGHTLPAPQPVAAHVAAVVTHELDVVATDANPGEHEHAAACAPFPAQLYPGPQTKHVPVLPTHALDVVDWDAQPGVHEQSVAGFMPPPQKLPRVHGTPPAVDDPAGQ